MMRLTWPIIDPQMGKLDLINEALDDYRNVVTEAGYVPVGLPHDWDIEAKMRRGSRMPVLSLVCVVEVMQLDREAA